MGYGRVNAYDALIYIPPAAPTLLRIFAREGMHPYLSWTDGGEPDIDHFVLKRQVSTWPPSYITVYGNNYTDTEYRVDYDGFTIKYWVKAVDEDEKSSPWSNQRSTKGYPVAKEVVEGTKEPDLPESYGLASNYPNPFNPSTRIQYSLPEASSVSLTIYDIIGREVIRWEQQEESGFKQLLWNGTDHSGQLVPAGIYIYRFMATSIESNKRFSVNRKMVMMK